MNFGSTKTCEEHRPLKHDGEYKTYDGAPCLRCQSTIRYRSTKGCAECAKKRARTYKRKRPPASHRDNGVMKCRLCRWRGEWLGGHLKVHGITSAEYRLRFGEPTAQDEWRDYYRAKWEESNGRPIHWAGHPERMINAAKAWYRRYGVPPTSSQWTTNRRKGTKAGSKHLQPARHPTAQTVRTEFGTWRHFLEAAGLGNFYRRQRNPKEKCKRGHVLAGENLLESQLPHRVCRACAGLRSRKHRATHNQGLGRATLKSIALREVLEWAF